MHLFGAPRLECQGHTLTVPRRQTRGLLYYLAAQDRPSPREDICFRFWPDVPEREARRNFSRLFTHLRRALPSPDLLLAHGEEIATNPGLVWSDAGAMGCLQRRAEASHDLHHLVEAADLYGGPFLHGFSLPDSPEFDEWATRTRAIHEQAHLRILRELMEAHAGHQDYRSAIATAERYLLIDNTAEEVHRRLIHFHAARDDHSNAIRVFEECARIMREELGVDPGPETRAAHQAVLRNRRAAGRPLRAPTWHTGPDRPLPFVGREHELRSLLAVHDRAKSRSGGIVMVSGEQGSGKSRLLREFAARVSRQSVLLVGAGLPGAELPYGPVVQALRGVIHDGSLMTTGMPPAYFAEAARVLPELTAMHPGIASSTASREERATANLFEALSQLLFIAAAGPYPGVLVIDDLQWADDLTLAWLPYFARHLAARRFMLFVAYQQEEAGRLDPLRSALRRLGTLTEVILPGLDVEAIAQLVTAASGMEAGAGALAGCVQRWTGGNALLAVQTLEALEDAGWDWNPAAPAAPLPLSPEVQATVNARLAGLAAPARRVLEAVAVLPQPFDLAAFCAASDCRPAEVAAACEDLTGLGLLRERSDAYEYCHPVICHVVARSLGPARRAVLDTVRTAAPDTLSDR